MSTPRLNWVLFFLFALATIGIFILALVMPAFRSMAYAPLRELVLPPPAPITLSVLYSTEKEAWLQEVVSQFQAGRPTVEGHPVQVKLEKMGSREIYLSLLDSQRQPDLISPASSLQISILEDLSEKKFGASLVNRNDPSACRSVVTTPLVLVAWKERASVLWGSNPGGNLWTDLHDALVNPQGWGAYGHPEWSYIKFGHTDPTKSNSGFMALLLMTASYFNKTDSLTTSDILSDPGYQQWIKDFENSVPEFGESTGTYMKDIVAYGPSRYDLVAVYEATAIEQLENARGRYGELSVYYPPATVLSDHPFCLLSASWVTPDKEKAARLFMDALVSRQAQEAALLKYGFRPVDPGVPLEQPGSPFKLYADSGLQITPPPETALPSGEVLDTLLTFWIRNIQR